MVSAAKGKAPSVNWDAATVAPVVLVSGAEEFFADRAMTAVRDQLRATEPLIEIHDIEASTYTAGHLLTLASPSLFGEPRLIRVSGVEKCTDEFITDMVDYLAHPDADTTIVLRHSGGVRGKKILETVRSGAGVGIEVLCAPLKNDRDKADFVTGEFRRADRKILPAANRALVQAFSSSLAELAGACAQLVADTSGDVTEATVEQYYGGRIEATAFKVVDLAVAGHRADALLALRHALHSGADPVPILSAFASKLRLIAKTYGDRRNANDLAGQLGAAPWQIERAQREAYNWTTTGLASAIVFTAHTDEDIKGAARDPQFALEKLINVVASFGANT